MGKTEGVFIYLGFCIHVYLIHREWRADKSELFAL